MNVGIGKEGGSGAGHLKGGGVYNSGSGKGTRPVERKLYQEKHNTDGGKISLTASPGKHGCPYNGGMRSPDE